jgi:hypothetical protein
MKKIIIITVIFIVTVNNLNAQIKVTNGANVGIEPNN